MHVPPSDGWPGMLVEVRSSHVDMFGHMNHTCYLEFMEWGRFAWSEFHGFPIPAMVRDERVGPAVIRVHVNFRRECRCGDLVRVHAAAASARRQIGIIQQEIWDERTGERVADAEITFVMMDLDERKVVPLPEAFLGAVARRAGGASGPA